MNVFYIYINCYSNLGASNNLGPVLNANNNPSNGGNSNWDQSQRMRGKVRYGSRHNNNHRSNKQQQQQQQQQQQGGGNMLQLGNTAGNSIPSINKSQVSWELYFIYYRCYMNFLNCLFINIHYIYIFIYM